MIDCLGPLRPGARVALVAASGPTPAGQVDRAEVLLRDWGLEPVRYPSLAAQHSWSHWLSGPDEVRAADVEDAWCDPSIDAVFCVRGGYGSIRILDRLDADRMRAATPKPFFGSSDVTGLHQWFADHLGVCTWHGPMVATGSLLDDEEATGSLHEAVFEPWAGRAFSNPDAEVLVPGTATGRLIGGNLSLLAMTTGARTNPPRDNTGTIALLEDVGEETYKYDAYVNTLLRAGWFDGVTALVLGSWADSDLGQVRSLVEELLVPLGLPTVWEFGFGHERGSVTLPLGVGAHLDATGTPTLTLLG